MKNICFQCGNPGGNMFGYYICDSCKAKLGLFTDEKIKQHITLFANSTKKRSYIEEINYRLNFIENDYIKKKIKLLHILERIEHI
jgi:hypothetical protein